jgi:hypothetical protein
MSFEFHHNPEFELLNFSRHGFVGYEAARNKIQVGCGMVIVTLDRHEFFTWNRQIEQQLDTFRDKVCPCQKYFMFTTGNDQVKLMLSWSEMDELHDLLSPAILVLDARGLIG